ncbi:MAG: cobalamin biosynthesis protein [Treponema sp.]|jgi:cobalt-precorrin 5A hydrolase|nr:cobalamin biosynthesis protein [Treponema sp.]
MIITLFAFTPAGKELRERLSKLLKEKGHQILPEEAGELPLAERTARAFLRGNALVFIGAAGIAVRAVGPLLRSKAEDPAVVVIDEKGTWTIALLSGHLGGANALTMEIAESLGSRPVITTATDINGVFAVDLWAGANGLVIGSMKKAREISMRLLRGEEITLESEYPIAGTVPRGLRVVDSTTETAGPEIRVSVYRGREADDSLHLIPRCVYLGIGCRKGAALEAIENTVRQALDQHGIDIRSVKAAGTIHIKKNEPALIRFCEQQQWPLSFFTAEELQAAGKGFTASAFVYSKAGVDNVCERAAYLASQCGKILFPKFCGAGVTTSAAAAEVSLSFAK